MTQIAKSSENLPAKIQRLETALSPLSHSEITKRVDSWLSSINLVVRKSEIIPAALLEAKIPAYTSALKKFPACCWTRGNLEKFCEDLKFFPSTGDLADFFRGVEAKYQSKKRVLDLTSESQGNVVWLEKRRKDIEERQQRELFDVQISADDMRLIKATQSGKMSLAEAISAFQQSRISKKKQEEEEEMDLRDKKRALQARMKQEIRG